MRIVSLTLLDPNGLTYTAIVASRKYAKWKFWDSSEIEEIFIGNSLAWYSPETGERLKSLDIETLLNNAIRREYLSELMTKHKPKPNLKPIK